MASFEELHEQSWKALIHVCHGVWLGWGCWSVPSTCGGLSLSNSSAAVLLANFHSYYLQIRTDPVLSFKCLSVILSSPKNNPKGKTEQVLKYCKMHHLMSESNFEKKYCYVLCKY